MPQTPFIAHLRPVARRGRRRALTLVELLLASVTAAIVCGATAAMMSAVSNATLTTRDLRNVHVSGQFAVTQINRLVRGSRAVGKIATSDMTLWLDDANGDDKLNLYETAILRYDNTLKQILMERLEKPDASIPSSTVTVAQFTDPAQLATLITGTDKRSYILAANVTAFAYDWWPRTPEARVVMVDFTITEGDRSTSYNLNASPQAPGDYLFYTQTKFAPRFDSDPPRKTRAYYSMYNGFTGHASLSSITLESNL
jgi:hypothetical protein